MDEWAQQFAHPFMIAVRRAADSGALNPRSSPSSSEKPLIHIFSVILTTGLADADEPALGASIGRAPLNSITPLAPPRRWPAPPNAVGFFLADDDGPCVSSSSLLTASAPCVRAASNMLRMMLSGLRRSPGLASTSWPEFSLPPT